MTDWPAALVSDLVTAAESCYDALGAPLAPGRGRAVFGTLPALDCPLLAVTLTSVEAKPAPVGRRCSVVPRARLAGWAVRCYPVMGEDGEAPNPEEEAIASMTLDADLGCLWDGLTQQWSDGALFPSFPGVDCEAVTFGSAVSYGPSGGVAGWSFPLTVDMAGVR